MYDQDFVNCPFCSGKAYFTYLRTDGVGNDRVFECENNKRHIAQVNEDLFWEHKDG